MDGHVSNAFEEHRNRSVDAAQSILDRLVSQVLAPGRVDPHPGLDEHKQALSRQQSAREALNHSRFGFQDLPLFPAPSNDVLANEKDDLLNYCIVLLDLFLSHAGQQRSNPRLDNHGSMD